MFGAKKFSAAPLNRGRGGNIRGGPALIKDIIILDRKCWPNIFRALVPYIFGLPKIMQHASISGSSNAKQNETNKVPGPFNKIRRTLFFRASPWKGFDSALSYPYWILGP